MKKSLLSLLMAMVATTLSLKAQTIVLDDGFENGIQDSVWTQEFVIGEHPWAVEDKADNLQWPNTVWQGSKRAYLRNTSGETEGYVTRLVSKVMDLSPAKVYQPMLIFWYANPKWTADRDTLRVLYKTGPNANWKQLAEYSSASASWQKVNLELPEVNETYQIAFEGTDNLGRGIVLDSVKLRSAPECTVPHDLTVTSLGAGSANIAWNASWDADFYDLIIALDSIDPDTVAKVADSIIAFNQQVSGAKQNYTVQLKSGEYYFAYIRSVCAAEKSLWNSEASGQYRFRVKATKYVPYSYDFNMDYNAGKISRDLEWTWGNNTGKYNPHINTDLNNTELKKYSADGTRALVFSGANNSTTAIPAGQYAYAATPDLADSAATGFMLRDCQVSFWATVASYTGKYAQSIIVGVMTDAEDITTFVPVDTISVWGQMTFQENIVSLENYNGDGTYVAFVSAFDKQNLFYIDDVKVERRPAVNKVTKITVNPRDVYASISWEGNAASYRVLVAKEELDLKSPKIEDIIVDTTLAANSFVCEGLEASHSWNNPYYVYVKAEGKDWSYRYPFVTITGQKELPMEFDMEQTSPFYTFEGVEYPKEISVFSNDPEYPHLYATGPYKGLSCLYLSKIPGCDSWVTFPMVDSIQNKQITFFLSGGTTAAQAHATVGVMSNPMDINTFVPVADFSYADGYIRCYANFADYKGPQGVIAIVWADVDIEGKNTINSIDDVKIEEIAACLPPENIKVETADKSVTVTWNKASYDEWDWILSTSAIAEAEWDDLATVLKKSAVKRYGTVTLATPEATPALEIDSLEPTVSYYIYVRTSCGEADKSWWVGKSFRTECSEAYTLPYTFTFDGQGTGSTARPLCWTGEYSFSRSSATSTTVYPYLSSSYAHSGEASLYMYSYFYRNSTTGVVTSDYGSMIVAPKLAEPLNEVLVEFWAYASSLNYELYVGTVSSPTDSDFVALDTIKVKKTSTWQKITVDFTKYKGTQQYVAFRTYNGKSSNTFYLDDITFKSARCARPYDIKAENAEQTSVDVVWDGMTDDKWQVKVLKKYAKLNTEKNKIASYQESSVLIDDTILTTKRLHVDGLKPLQKLYVYVRPTCGDSLWAVDSVKAGCKRVDPMQVNRETFETYPSGTSYDATYQADCWTVGINSTTAAETNKPYIYKSSTYASSGENVLRIYESSTYAPAWAASPEIICNDMKNLLVSFSFYASTSYYGVWGVMTDPEDLETFVVLDSLKGTGKAVQVYVDMKDYADSIPDAARYFAWRGRYNAADLFYIDDVSIIEQKCAITNPSYSELTSEQVRVSSGLRTNGEWELLLLTKVEEEIPTDSLESATYELADSLIFYRDTLTARSKVVTGLKEKTRYYGYTRAICEGGNSYWRAFSFITPCLALTPEAIGTITFSKDEGYMTGTSGEMPCWTRGNKNSTSTSYIPYVNNTATYKHNDNNYLYLYTTASADGGYAIMPQLNVDSIKNYQINFFARGYNGTSYNSQAIIGVVTDPSDLNTFVVVDTLTFSRTQHEAFTVSFENYDGDFLGNYGKYVMFLSEFGATNYAYISEISVEKIPSCRPVKAITADSIGDTFAYISFESEAPKARLLVAAKSVVDSLKATYDKWIADTTVTKFDSIRIDNLDPNTSYYAYVQNICSDTDSGKISLLEERFITDCPSEGGFKAPYFVDFEENSATGSGNRPDCWEGVYLTWDTVGTTQSYPQVSTSNAYSGKNNLYMYSYLSSTTSATATNTKSIAVAPKVNGNLNDYLVSFYARQSSSTAASYGKRLYIGYVTNTEQKQIDSTFVSLGYVEVSGTVHQYYEFSLLDKPAIPAGARIALRADWELQEGLTATSRYANFYIDNFRIGLPPTCYPPTLEAGKATLTSVSVNITPAEQGGERWELAVIPDSVYAKATFEAKDYLDTVTNTRIADTVNYEIKGLQEGTIYQVYARTVCGGKDGNSEWTETPTQVITKYYYKDSYTFGFEKDETWVRSPLSTSDANYLHPALEAGYDTLQGSTKATTSSYYPYAVENTTSVYGYGPKAGTSGKAAMRLYAYKSTTANYYGDYVIFPAIGEPKARSFEFKVRQGYLTYSSMKVSTTYASQLQVGTIDKDGDISSFEALGTIDLPLLDKTVVAAASNNFLFTNVTIDLDSATLANKQIVLYQPQVVKGTQYAQNFIDDVKLGATKGYGLVSFSKITTTDSTATIKWNAIGGPWNLYVTTFNEDDDKTDTVFSALNISDVTEKVVTGLKAQTTYTAILVCAEAPKKASYKVDCTKSFKTPCTALEPNANGEFFWDFNDPAEWEASDMICANYNVTNAHDTAFHKPGCFTTGWDYYAAPTTTSVNYNWMIIRKGINYASTTQTGSNYSATYAKYEYGRDDSPALKVNTCTSTTAGTNYKPYIVLPALNCDFDTMMIEFYGRCFANYANDHATASNRNKIVSVSYMAEKFSKSIVVGTMDDPNDFSTFVAIDTLTYKQSSLPATTLVTNDPAKLRYWEKMQTPLSGAKGKYIVLYQPAYGLFFLDDLSIKPIGDNIFAPYGPKVDSITTTSAKLSWSVKHPSFKSVVVVTNSDDKDKEVIRDTIVGTTYTATGLKPATIYKWYMYQINGEQKSSETERQQFTTECLAINPDYTTGFESDEEGFWIVPGQTVNTYKQNKCWIYGNAGTSAVGTNIYNYKNTATVGYSHDGAYALRLYAYSTTIQTYAAMPAMDVTAYDTLQVNFWMRPGYHGLGTSANAGKISTQYTLGTNATTKEYYYAKSVIVGTMTDPSDPKTFVPIDTINYNGTFAVGDVANSANDYLFQKKKVSLRGATGPYVAFMSTLNAKGAENKSTYDYVWLDDISFSLVQECSEPTELTTSDITSNSATLSWTGAKYGQKYYVQVSTDATFYYDTAFVFNDTIEATSLTLVDTLKAFTTYAWRVQSICGEEYGTSEFSQNALFTTARIPFYLEDFRENSISSEWTFGKNQAELVLDSADVEISGATSTDSYGFHRVTTSYGIMGAHVAVPFYSSSTVSSTTYDYYWMVSPSIYLEPEKNAHLTFDLALTQSSTTTPNANPATEANIADDFTFMVVVSDDGGKTWKKENILGLWNDTIIGASKLLDIPVAAENQRYDLAKYAGKHISVGFYRQAETYLSTTSAVHVGNIRVAYYDKFAVDTTACQYQDIEAYEIFIDGDKTPVGTHSYMSVLRAGESDALKGALDSVYNLTAEYFEAPEMILSDTICEGDSYTSVDFTGKTRPGIYRRKLQSVEHCDSIITLYLNVTPTMHAEAVQQTICQGESFNWNGKNYDRAGLYKDTLISSLGCDSIETLVLSYYADEDTIYDAIRITIDELPYTYQNQAHPYVNNQAPIVFAAGTQPGEYIEKAWVMGNNCAAVLVLTAEIYDPHEGLEDLFGEDGNGAHKVLYNENLYIISNGKWYNAEGKLVDDPRETSR